MIVSVGELNRHLSGPQWSAEQTADAEQILAGCEGDLEDWFCAPITLGKPVTMNATIIDAGLVLTRHPVYQVTSLNGVAITDNALPEGWELREDEGALFKVTDVRPAIIGYSLDPFAGYATDTVAVTYVPGWGPRPSLVKAIKQKAGAIFLNRHDDTITARDLDASTPPPLQEQWTDAELSMLRRYKWRNVVR